MYDALTSRTRSLRQKTNAMIRTSYLRKQIFLPQDHGSWVFIFSPLFIGLFLGGKFTFASLSLTLATIAAFLLRQPVTMAVAVGAESEVC